MIPSALAEYLDIFANRVIERFESRYVITPDGCWEWQGTRNKLGYGRFNCGHVEVLAHRFSFEMNVGPIPDGLVLDHLCRNPACVNPEHLEPVTQGENVLRGRMVQGASQARLDRTHCPAGHPYDEENTYLRPDGGRDCRICMRRRNVVSRAKIRRSKTTS